MSRRDEVIEELVSLVIMQDEEIKKLKKRIGQIKRYLAIYEEYIERGNE